MIWQCGPHTLEIPADKPLIMGILNVTPDSFSDGGEHDAPEAALAHARLMIEQGADIIDVGGESTRPGAAPVTEQEELARVLPVVRALSPSTSPLISIDTRHASVARACVQAGAHIINDVSGFRDPAMREVAAGCDAGLVVMHMLGEPATMQQAPCYSEAGVVADVRDYLLQQAALLEAAGVARERICIDPGPGFGKTYQQNLELLEHLDGLAATGYPVMLAVSRKTFLGTYYGQPEPATRIWSSVAAAMRGAAKGASVLRVHDVAQHAQALASLRQPAATAYIALGCNSVPDRVQALQDAVDCIRELPFTQVTAVSQVYESEPAYYLDQASFGNAVIAVRTRLHPRVLLQELQGFEYQAGRRRSFRNAPRPLDLDILDYQGVTSNDPVLTLPHPKQLERDFVMMPFMEIAPGHVLADGTPIGRDAVSVGRIVGVLGQLS
ncbi:MAG: dihydropteroate synthase [Coriobacteriales bacterium]|nr:dihydropteroate synthase [Coriobacteriales bacterium]